jgi:hypothetical protein
MSDAEQLLRTGYRAFNARDVEAAVELMHTEVDWPNAWEGGRVVGRAAVRDYWKGSSPPSPAMSSPRASPMNRTAASRSMSTKSVHEVRTGELISDSRVRHRYRLEDGLIVRMDVLEPPDQR